MREYVLVFMVAATVTYLLTVIAREFGEGAQDLRVRWIDAGRRIELDDVHLRKHRRPMGRDADFALVSRQANEIRRVQDQHDLSVAQLRRPGNSGNLY